jgi:D-alanyl-D-alanine carboxypeptidase
MLRFHSGVLQLLGRLLRRGQRFLRTLGKSIQSHCFLNTRALLRLIYRPMTSRAGRWSLAGTGAALAIAPALILLHLQGTSVPHSGVAAAVVSHGAVVTDLNRPPWFGLRLLADPVVFGPGGSTPTDAPVVKARAAILVDPDSGRILYAENDHAQLPPASTVKLLTALIVLRNFSPDRLIAATPDALVQGWDESKMGLHPGDVLNVRELLTGLLTISANDAATVLAVDTVGMTRFVGAMNAEVATLGLHDTHVISPVGLDDPATYSSAYDLATLATVDMNNFGLFRSIVATQSVVLPASALHPAFYLNNVNLLLRMYPAAMGVKTGYTGNSGACEVGMAQRDGHRLIDVILDGDLVYSTSRRLLDWGFTQEGLASQLPPPSPSPSPAPHH